MDRVDIMIPTGEKIKEEFIICACFSLDHIIHLWYDEDEPELVYMEILLTTYRGFLARLWYGLKYAFGFKSRYGAWDSFIFDTESLMKLRLFLDDYRKSQEKKK